MNIKQAIPQLNDMKSKMGNKKLLVFNLCICVLFGLAVKYKQSFTLASKPIKFEAGILDVHTIGKKDIYKYYLSLINEKSTKAGNTLFIDNARKAIAWNWLFIVSFPLFIYFFYSIIKKEQVAEMAVARGRTNEQMIEWENRLLVEKALVLVALGLVFVLHCIHQVYLIQFLKGQNIVSILEKLKFLSTLIYLGYAFVLLVNISLISAMLSFFTHLLKYNFPIVVSLLVLFFIVSFDQGQNIFLVLCQNNIFTGLFFVVLNVMAFWHWYLSKIMQKKFMHCEKIYNPTTNEFDFVERKIKFLQCDSTMDFSDFEYEEKKRYSSTLFRKSIPRLLGVVTYLIPYYGINKILADSSAVYWGKGIAPSVLFIVIFFSLFIILNNWKWMKAINDWFASHKKAWFVILACLVLLMLAVMPFGDRSGKGLQLRGLSILFQMVFFLVVVMGRDAWAWIAKGNINCKVMIAITTTTLYGIFCLFFLLFNQNAYLNWNESKYNIFIVLFSLIMGWEWLLAKIIQQGIFKKVSIVSILFILYFCIINLFNKEIYRLHSVGKEFNYTSLQTDTTYLRNWLTQQAPILKAGDSCIYIINGYGGGIRASAFVYYHIALMDKAFASRYNHSFMNHIVCFSTASGSSLGSVKLVNDYLQDGQLMNDSMMQIFYQHDYLSSVLLSNVGSDWWMQLGSPEYCRDRMQEKNWTLIDSNLGKSFFDVYNNAAKPIPLLFFNTSESQSGKASLLAPIKLSEQFFASKNAVAPRIDTTNISMADAALLTARFPVISPGARTLKNEMYFDGGLTENSGAGSNALLLTELQYVLKQMNLDKELKIKVISMHNTYAPNANDTTLPYITQPSGLLNLVINAGLYGNTELAEQALGKACKQQNISFQRYYITDTITQGILPLGWLLSDSASYKLYRSAQINTQSFIKSIQ
jgi:hypothetical protein